MKSINVAVKNREMRHAEARYSFATALSSQAQSWTFRFWSWIWRK